MVIIDDLQKRLNLGPLFDLLVQVGFVEAYINSIPSWHQMVIIDDLQKRLNLGPLFDLLFGHTFGDHSWVSVDASNQSVSERFVGSTIIGRFDNYSLSTGISSGQDKDNLALFHNLTHL